MSAIHAAVSCGLSQISVTARMYICFGNYKFSKRGIFFTNRTNVSGGQANVVPNHRSRIKINISC